VAFERKPRAAMHLAVVPQLPPAYAEARRLLCAGRRDGYREFAEILLLHREFPAEHVQAALEEALRKGMPHAQVIRQLILNRCPAYARRSRPQRERPATPARTTQPSWPVAWPRKSNAGAGARFKVV
jgi:hypothetical protein